MQPVASFISFVSLANDTDDKVWVYSGGLAVLNLLLSNNV